MRVLPSFQGSVFSPNYRCYSDFQNGRKQDAPKMLLDKFKMQMTLYTRSHTQPLCTITVDAFSNLLRKIWALSPNGSSFSGIHNSARTSSSQHTHSQKKNNIFIAFYFHSFIKVCIYFWRQKVAQFFRKQNILDSRVPWLSPPLVLTVLVLSERLTVP